MKKKRASAKSLAWERWHVPAICFGLAAITWIVFGQSLGFDFVNYDDSFYVYQNHWVSDGLTRAGLIRAFTHPLVGNWHPLTSISLMLDATFFGLKPGGYHFVNVLLHTTAVLLLFLVLKSMTGATWRSAFVAALFAIHPLRAESVAWISERKDVLSANFFFLALWAYVRYARSRSLGRYLLLAAFFALGLLSKAMLVTLPFLLLLLDYWPLRRFPAPGSSGHDSSDQKSLTVSRLILEKLPLVALVVAASIATILAQKLALEAAQDWPLRWRIDNALVTVWVYLRQMVWPTQLAVFYPHPRGHLSLSLGTLAVVALLLVSSAGFLWRKKCPYFLTGWFWYLGMLVPVVGLVQVGWQAHADRYTYLPQIGIYLLLTWGVADLTARWRWRRFLLASAAGVVIAVLMTVAHAQTSLWSDSVRLWTHTLASTTDNDVAERGLGTALLKVGRIDDAIAHDRAALRIRPGDANGLTNLANALLQKKDFTEAIQHYREVVRLRPNESEVRRNLGKALVQNGAAEEGIVEFKEALRFRPNDSDAAYSLGNIFLEQGRTEEAIAYFRKAIEANAQNVAAHYNLAIALSRNVEVEEAIAEFKTTLRLQPQHADAHNNLAIALLKQSRIPEAIEQWKQALQLQPANADIHNNLAVAFLRQDQLAAAVAEWRETLRLQPEKPGTQISLAWILATSPDATIRNGVEALQLARSAFQTSAERNLMTYRVLAAAFAETGRFSAAVKAVREGMERANDSGQQTVARLLEGDLAVYEQGAPLRDPTNGIGDSPSP